MYKMLVIDLDGTLLNDKGEISEYSIEILKKCSIKKMTIVIATGRSYVGIPNSIKQLDCIDYYITSNGATCVDKNGVKIYTDWINTEDTLFLKENADICVVEYLIDGKWYIDKNDISKIKTIIKNKNVFDYILNTRIVEDRFYDSCIKNKIMFEKININFEDTNKQKVIDIINRNLKNNKKLRSWTDKAHKMDLYSISANKGNAVKVLSNKLNILQEEIIAFGNDENDLELFEYVGYAVSVNNAKDNIKSKTKYVTYDNNADGVAKYLEKYINNF